MSERLGLLQDICVFITFGFVYLSIHVHYRNYLFMCFCEIICIHLDFCGGKRMSDPWNWEIDKVPIIWMLLTEPGTSAKKISALMCWANSLNLRNLEEGLSDRQIRKKKTELNFSLRFFFLTLPKVAGKDTVHKTSIRESIN